MTAFPGGMHTNT